MEKGVFGFILRYSKKQQVTLLLVTMLSFPFYYYSLDLPKTIINDAIGGSAFPTDVLGYELGQIDYLLSLSFAFLALVLINGGFKYFLNVYRGVVGERMLRRFRYQLVNQVLRFPLPHFRNISEGEIVSMVTAETEPLGGFMAESLSLPAFQGGMLITALIFMFVQDPILGIAAIALYPVQGWVIPKLQRKVNLLNKERIQNVRKLSERINEMVAGSAEIHAHDTSQYEMSDFSTRLGKIFDIRFQVYRKKFFIKFVNNFLAQVTPFFFYSIGGYLVITGDLSIGALVAILAAYKDLSPPWKELLNFYQRMEDCRIKYTQLIDRFDAPNMYPEAVMAASLEGGARVDGNVVASNLVLEEDEGTKILENANFTFSTSEHVGITGRAGGPKSAVAQLIARQISPTSGNLTIGGSDLSTTPEHVTGRQIGYVDQEAYIRSGTIRDNLFYGLKHYPQSEPNSSDEAKRAQMESEQSGNSPYPYDSDWLDLSVINNKNGDGLLQRAMSALQAVGLEGDIMDIGVRSTIDPSQNTVLAEGALKARQIIRTRVKDPEYNGLVEAWDWNAYNENASVAENILFGTPVDDTFDVESLSKNEIVLATLKKVGLYDDFIEMGRKVAALMVELFHDLEPGHEFFERFSFISADDLPDYQVMLKVPVSDGLSALTEEQRERLLQLPFKLVRARHRLGILDEEVEPRLLAARKAFSEDLPENMSDKISFFDAETYNPASSILDNALFGKVDSNRADSAEKIQSLAASVFDELDLRLPILETGLTFEVGISGRRLSAPQRQKLAIARNLVKDPQMFIVNEATGVLDSGSKTSVFTAVKSAMKDRGLVWVDSELPDPSQFDRIFMAEAGKVKETSIQESGGVPVSNEADSSGEDDGIGTDAELLARAAFFAGLDRSSLKLLAFTSKRQTLEAQEILIQQGESGDVAYVVVDGTFSIVADTAQGKIKIADTGRGSVIGELALLCEAPRTATVRANEHATVLKIDKGVFLKLIQDNPAVGANLSHILAAKLEAMMRTMSAHYELYDPVSMLQNQNLFIDNMKTTVHIDERRKHVSSFIRIDFDRLTDLEPLQSNLDNQQLVIREIASRIKPTVRAADSFGKLSGFRYGIIARGLETDETSELLLGRISESLGEPLQVDGHSIDLRQICDLKIFELNTENLHSLTEKA
ncbi:MAG: cyclic nucleotide-binding domain-containing protein [Rhodospirillales bacterium]|nr:cyclic nucleotide-binding domain-containing protein [Rhodospirillales bacterium]MBT4040565.1 cyclic nucleotide-binding domain-containing protein [Rhodospirillales bacterium]MBT4627010.1 cyclic nucleotide-binding domain-containing protein [Rhodospirillales bacterium]MBT5352231.1 cyclic nucleotide-binding domain-containing protein [Rhodospirillales bacterium]MBT5520615.1 cyclic nucleotide-binding domain-containing protein [Rhodospirillales bacterium]